MSLRTRGGRQLEPLDIDRIADKAEAGLDDRGWRPSPGRRPLGERAGHSPRIAVRVPRELRQAVEARATAEGRSLSAVVRSLLEEYAEGRGPRTVSKRRPHRGR